MFDLRRGKEICVREGEYFAIERGGWILILLILFKYYQLKQLILLNIIKGMLVLWSVSKKK